MIGTLNLGIKEATVVGGGIAGLLAAYRLDKLGFEVTLLELSDRLGGLLKSQASPWGLVESAAQSFQVSPPLAALCKELEVELVPVRPDSKKRFVLRDGRLCRFPLGNWELMAAAARAYFALADRKSDASQVTLESWALRHLGKAACDYLVNPALRGVYAARPSEIEVGLAFPQLVVPHGNSAISALLAAKVTRRNRTQTVNRDIGRPMMAPLNGMGELVAALERRLENRLGSRLKRGCNVEALPDSPNTMLCVPAQTASALLKSEDPALAQALSTVSYTPLASVTVFVSRSGFKKIPKGVGVLMPERERRELLGILFNSSSFPGRVNDDQQVVSLTFMVGGSSAPESVESPAERFRMLILNELQSTFQFTGDILHMEIARWLQAIPKYNSNLRNVWKNANQGWCKSPGHLLFSNYTGQVSIRGMVETVSKLQNSMAQ